MYRKQNEKGFTLIELLIVIVIIGILAGVLISVLDPVRQQNRARNASAKSAVNKVAFAINSARAGIGRLPYDMELSSELENITINADGGATCAVTDPLSLGCVFGRAGTKLPSTCSSTYAGTGTNACYFYVISPDPSGSLFRVIAKKYKLDPSADETTEPSEIYVFDSNKGFYECPTATVDAAAHGAAAFTTDISLIASGCSLVDE